MSFRDDNKVNYDYGQSLENENWTTNTTGGSLSPSIIIKIIELTKVVESLQNRIEVLESIESKEWENKLDS